MFLNSQTKKFIRTGKHAIFFSNDIQEIVLAKVIVHQIPNDLWSVHLRSILLRWIQILQILILFSFKLFNLGNFLY